MSGTDLPGPRSARRHAAATGDDVDEHGEERHEPEVDHPAALSPHPLSVSSRNTSMSTEMKIHRHAIGDIETRRTRRRSPRCSRSRPLARGCASHVPRRLDASATEGRPRHPYWMISAAMCPVRVARGPNPRRRDGASRLAEAADAAVLGDPEWRDQLAHEYHVKRPTRATASVG